MGPHLRDIEITITWSLIRGLSRSLHHLHHYVLFWGESSEKSPRHFPHSTTSSPEAINSSGCGGVWLLTTPTLTSSSLATLFPPEPGHEACPLGPALSCGAWHPCKQGTGLLCHWHCLLVAMQTKSRSGICFQAMSFCLCRQSCGWGGLDLWGCLTPPCLRLSVPAVKDKVRPCFFSTQALRLPDNQRSARMLSHPMAWKVYKKSWASQAGRDMMCHALIFFPDSMTCS